MGEELDDALRARLHAALDAAPLVAPDPGQARYRRAPVPRPRALASPALGFVAGVAATVAFAVVATGSAEPQVWLQRAAGGVHRITDIIEPASNSTPEPAASPSESPSSGAGGAVAPPTGRSTPEPEHGGDRRPGPSPAPTSDGGDRTAPPPSPSPSSTSDGGGGGGGGDHDGQAPTASPSPSPSSGSEGH